MKLEELRDKFRGEPEKHKPTGKVNLGKIRDKRSPYASESPVEVMSEDGTLTKLPPRERDGAKVGRVTLATGGRDGLIGFGKWKDHTLSEVFKEDPSYLRWMSGHATCPDDVHEVIETILRDGGEVIGPSKSVSEGKAFEERFPRLAERAAELAKKSPAAAGTLSARELAAAVDEGLFEAVKDETTRPYISSGKYNPNTPSRASTLKKIANLKESMQAKVRRPKEYK